MKAFRPAALLLPLALAACGDGESAPPGEANVPDSAQAGPEAPPAALAETAVRVPSDSAEASFVAQETTDAEDASAEDAPEVSDPSGGLHRVDDDGWEPPHFERPDSIRGIYLTAWSAGSAARSEALLDLARETELNTFVIDIKDASGYVSHRTGVEMAREVGADGETRIWNLEGLLDRLAEEGIYPVARIVVFKDHLLPAERPDLAIQQRDAEDGDNRENVANGELDPADAGPLGGAGDGETPDPEEPREEFWRDAGGHPWTSPHAKEVWDYHVELAREVAELGFPEIQWDYVRFPDIPSSVREDLSFPGDRQGTRPEVIRQFLDHSRRELEDLDVRVTADVFGVAASARADVGIGQVWEEFIDVVDAALPMVYPSHYWTGSFGLEEPNAHPYEVIWESMGQARDRSEVVEGAGEVIPWLQDFSMGSPAYGAPEVRAQIQATYDRGIPHWILWNPGSRYTREALAPAEGFAEDHDPLIRLAGEVVPASYRLRRLLNSGDGVATDSAVVDWQPSPEIPFLRSGPMPWEDLDDGVTGQP